MLNNLTLDKQIEEVVRLRDEDDLTFGQIGQKLHFSERTARRRYAAGVLVEEMEGEDLTEFPDTEDEEKLKAIEAGEYLLEKKVVPERFKPLTRTGDAVVVPDWHVPLHDPELINMMISAAKTLGITNLIIPGDFWNMDQLSSYLPHQPEAALDIERYDGNLILKTLLNTFEEIDMTWGNHDFRLSKKLGYKRSYEECMNWMMKGLTDDERSRIRVSELDYMYYYPMSLGQGGPKWRLMHQTNFSSVPLSVGRALATKYNCNVMTSHSHHCAIGVAVNGKHVVIEGGGVFKKEMTEYIQKSNKHHEWVPGFTIFKDGVPTLYSPVFGNI